MRVRGNDRVKDPQRSVSWKIFERRCAGRSDPKRLKIPTYWIRPLQSVSTESRYASISVDMHYTPVRDVVPEFPISATYRNTHRKRHHHGPHRGLHGYVDVDNKTFSQPVTVTMDPRVKTSAAGIRTVRSLVAVVSAAAQARPDGKKFDGVAEQLTKTQSAGSGTA